MCCRVIVAQTCDMTEQPFTGICFSDSGTELIDVSRDSFFQRYRDSFRSLQPLRCMHMNEYVRKSHNYTWIYVTLSIITGLAGLIVILLLLRRRFRRSRNLGNGTVDLLRMNVPFAGCKMPGSCGTTSFFSVVRSQYMSVQCFGDNHDVGYFLGSTRATGVWRM